MSGPIDPRPGWVRQRTYELHKSGLSWIAARERAQGTWPGEPSAEGVMNAAATNGNGDSTEVDRLRGVVADLQAQRSRLLAEVTHLREARNEALRIAADARQENTQLRAPLQELENR
jgi:hypothetical protein